MLTKIVFPIIGLIAALIWTFIVFAAVIYPFGGRIKFRPLRIEYTAPIERIRWFYIRRIERRMRRHPPTEPYEIHVRKYILKKTKFLINLLIIQYVFFNVFMIASWCVLIWSTWK